jgi:hypothetical protein
MSNCPRPRTRPATGLASASHEDDTMNQTTSGCRRRGWCPAQPLRAGALAVTTGLVLLTAACGGSPSSTGSGGSAHAGGSAHSTSAVGYSRCVRSHGIPDFPDPDSSGQIRKETAQQLGVSDSVLRAATHACANLNPNRQGSPTLTAHDQQDYLRAAACMRSHGITNFPDPTFSGGSVLPFPSSIDTKSTQFTQARQTCIKLIPAGLRGGSGG